MSDSEGDFESADEDAAAAEPETAPAAKSGTAEATIQEPDDRQPDPAVVTSQPPAASSADNDAAGPTVELSFGSDAGGGGGGGGGGGWTSWGLSWGQSFISGAKSGVSVLAKELGDGLDTVSRTVESVLEAPSPEDMAGGAGGSEADAGAAAASSSNAEAASAEPDAPVDADAGSGGGSGGWLRSGWRVGGALTTSVTQTGSYLMSGSLDLLEALGKRTMDALQESDPGFQRTKALLGRGRRPNLSELLREAQASGAATAAAAAASSDADGGSGSGGADVDSPDFACQFDRLNGSAYLDGLQTLAGECELRLQAKLSASARPHVRALMADILARLERVREADDNNGGGDDEERPSVEAALAALPAQFAPANAWLKRAVAECLEEKEAEEQKQDEAPAVAGVAALQVDCVRRLAGLTASTLHYLLKAASLASAAAAGAAATTESADRLADLCLALIGCADVIRERACVSMQAAAAATAAAAAPVEGDEHAVNQAMTQAILEAEGAKAYVQDAFLLLAPALQLAALEEPAPAAAAATTDE